VCVCVSRRVLCGVVLVVCVCVLSCRVSCGGVLVVCVFVLASCLSMILFVSCVSVCDLFLFLHTIILNERAPHQKID